VVQVYIYNHTLAMHVEYPVFLLCFTVSRLHYTAFKILTSQMKLLGEKKGTEEHHLEMEI